MPKTIRQTPRLRLMAALTALALLGGCATLSQDNGFGTVQGAAKEQLGKDLKWVRSEADQAAVAEEVGRLLSRELDADAAVQVALLNNPGLQATYSELGIAEASLVQAGRLRNPGFTFTHLDRAGDLEIERQFLFDLMGLLTMPTRTAIETRRFEQARLRVTAEVLKVAADARRSWFSTVAAGEAVRYMEDVQTAAEASAELARRMARVGNWSRLDQAREQVFYAEVAASHARVRQAAVSERERLTRLLGLQDGAGIRLPLRLPELPKAAKGLPDVEATAVAQRLDVQMAKKNVEGLAKSLGLTRATRFVNVLEASYLRNSASGEPRQTGYEIEISIPLFDFGEAKVARAEAVYMQAVNRLAETAVAARSQVREAYQGYRTAYDLARHYRDEIVPLRKRISEENVLRYNGMLIGVFELLADARSQMASINAYIEALRDFWLAETDLQMAMTAGGGGRGVAMTAAMPAAESGGGH